MNKKYKYSSSGIPDSMFIRGKVPMTKSEVRAVTVSKLKLYEGLKVLDIGAGTGSVSIEMAIKGCFVTSIERNPDGIELINANKDLFELDNINVIDGLAPQDLPNELFDRVFIGGSGGKLDEVFNYLSNNLNKEGIIVANTITIENTSKLLAVMKEYKYEDIEAVQVNVSRSKKVGPYHMMMAENPITIISARKGR